MASVALFAFAFSGADFVVAETEKLNTMKLSIPLMLSAILILLLNNALRAQSAAHTELRAGDKLYDQKKYLQAENAYQEASGDPTASYNAGNAAYQQGKFELAVKHYQVAALSQSSTQSRADAFFNLGNAYLQLGKYREAITAYQRSLRLQPNRTDGKKNLQIARNKLNEKQDPPPPPPPPKRQPPPPPPRNYYVDRAQTPRKKEMATGTMTATAARQKLNSTIEEEEQKNARQYRALPPKSRPDRTKKDW
jgi:tetratricopeptide (TPR) repeat protein